MMLLSMFQSHVCPRSRAAVLFHHHPSVQGIMGNQSPPEGGAVGCWGVVRFRFFPLQLNAAPLLRRDFGPGSGSKRVPFYSSLHFL